MNKHTEAPNYNEPPKFPEFPREEFQTRYRRLQIEMEKHGLSVLVATIEPHYRYLTGHRNQRWPNILRPRAAILPAEGDPIIITIGSEAWGIQEVTWIRDIRVFAGPRVDDGFGIGLVREILKALSDLGINSGLDRVGMELGWHMHPGISHQDFERFRKTVAPVEIVDASQIWWEVQKIKSPLEIDYIREAAQITSKAFEQIEKEIEIGMTEMDVERRFNALQLAYGCERPTYVPVNFHRGRDPQEHYIVFGLSTERKLEEDMTIDMDGGCQVKGYWSDFNRTFATGKVHPKAAEVYRVLREAVTEGIRAVKPGRPITDVAKAQVDVLIENGYMTTEQECGIFGHGLGLYSTSPPYVNMRDTTIMSEGLFFTIEPGAVVPGWGHALAEENVVVTKDGCELLSVRAPESIPVVG